MTKEEYLKGLILQRWTLKDFAAKINMPYGTLYSILKNVDGGSMYNIVKICSGLHISTNELSQIESPGIIFYRKLEVRTVQKNYRI